MALGTDGSDDDPLYSAALGSYEELFSLGDMVRRADELYQDSQLAAYGQELVLALAESDFGALIPVYFHATDTLAQAIDELEQDIRGLEAELETAQAQRRELTRARDLAWETYTTVARKVAEMNVGAAVQGTVVRFAAPAALPTQPVSRKLMQTAALAGAVAFMLAIGVAFVTNLLNPDVDPSAALRTRRVSPSPAAQ